MQQSLYEKKIIAVSKTVGYCWRNQASGKGLPETGVTIDQCGSKIPLGLLNTLTGGIKMALIRIRQQYPVVFEIKARRADSLCLLIKILVRIMLSSYAAR
jgi:hypothetical protein